MKRYFLRARRLSLCSAASGLCIAGLISTLSLSAEAAQKGGKGALIQGQGNVFLSNIVSGGGGWGSASSWQSLLRTGTPSLFGAQIVSLQSFSNSHLLQSSLTSATPVLSGGVSYSGGTVKLTSQGATLAGGPLLFVAAPTVSANAASFTLAQSDLVTEINLVGDMNGAMLVSPEVPAAQTAPPRPPRPVTRPVPPAPPKPPAVSR